MKLYIVNTMYHIILAIADIESNSANKSEILIFKDFYIDDSLYKKLEEKFEKIYVFKGTREKNIMKRIRDILYFLYNRENIIFNKYNEIIYSNDYRIEVQKIINYFKNDNCKFTYIEDGFAAYGSHIIKKNVVNNIIKKLITLFKYKHINVYGTFIDPDLVKVIDKENIRKELKKFNVEEIEMKNIIYSIEYIYSEKIKTLNIKNDSIILLIDNSESIKCKSKYIDIIKMLINKYEDRNIYIKYHPRENEDFLNIDHKEITFLDKNLNSEAILVECCKKNVIFISGISTSLIMASKLLDKKDGIYSIARGCFNEELVECIEKMGIGIL